AVTPCGTRSVFLFVWHRLFHFGESAGTRSSGRAPRDGRVEGLYEGEVPGTTGPMISPRNPGDRPSSGRRAGKSAPARGRAPRPDSPLINTPGPNSPGRFAPPHLAPKGSPGRRAPDTRP